MKQYIQQILDDIEDASNGFFCIGKRTERTHGDQAPNS